MRAEHLPGTVSVIVPTHDRAALLGRALDSVRAQTRPADEILVVDDGSTDGTRELLARYPEVRVLSQQQRGVSAARNVGLRAARGEWLALLDSDDEWRPTKLARQLDALARAPEQRLCHTDEVWIRRGRRVNPMRKHQKRGGFIYRHCLPLCCISPSSVVLHREVLCQVGLFDESLPACEDYDLWLRICLRHPVLFLDEPLLVKYGGHADQLSARYPGMDRFRIQALEGMLELPELVGEEREATRATLLEKLEIYLAGARKRGRHDEVASYEARRARWADAQARPPEEGEACSA
ncbi:MAG: glycosyltransferase family 2 protein [Deltaproteobacteria bacterium]|nr:glycosyltransferase family 2 protein [Deltaproteobacteria bacterium]